VSESDASDWLSKYITDDMGLGLRYISNIISLAEHSAPTPSAALPYRDHPRSLNLELSFMHNSYSSVRWEVEGDSYLSECPCEGADGPWYAADWNINGPDRLELPDWFNSWDDVGSDDNSSPAEYETDSAQGMDFEIEGSDTPSRLESSSETHLVPQMSAEEQLMYDLVEVSSPGNEFEMCEQGVRKILLTTAMDIGYVFWDLERLQRWKLFCMTLSSTNHPGFYDSLNSQSVRAFETRLAAAVRHHFSKHLLPDRLCSPEDILVKDAFEDLEARLGERYADEEKEEEERARQALASSV
jgi:hypothetical protein